VEHSGFDQPNANGLMGKAKRSFSIMAGGYVHIFPATNFYAAMQPVLHLCGKSFEPAASMESAYVLLVTWFTPNQPTSSYQVMFNSPQACEAARLLVLKDAERLKSEKAELGRQAPYIPPGLSALSSPSASAVCVRQ
jgi:hypothetical protein